MRNILPAESRVADIGAWFRPHILILSGVGVTVTSGDWPGWHHLKAEYWDNSVSVQCSCCYLTRPSLHIVAVTTSARLTGSHSPLECSRLQWVAMTLQSQHNSQLTTDSTRAGGETRVLHSCLLFFYTFIGKYLFMKVVYIISFVIPHCKVKKNIPIRVLWFYRGYFIINDHCNNFHLQNKNNVFRAVSVYHKYNVTF